MTLPATRQGVLRGPDVQLRGKLYAIAVENAAGSRVVPRPMDVLGAERQIVGRLVAGVDVDSLKLGERPAIGRGELVTVLLAIGDTDVPLGAPVLTEIDGIAINIIGLAAADGIIQTDQAGTKCFAVDIVDLEQTALPRTFRTGSDETVLVNFDIAGLCPAIERRCAGDILAIVIRDRAGQHWVIQVLAAEIFFDRNGEEGAGSDGIRVVHLWHVDVGDTDGGVEFDWGRVGVARLEVGPVPTDQPLRANTYIGVTSPEFDRAVRTDGVSFQLALDVTDLQMACRYAIRCATGGPWDRKCRWWPPRTHQLRPRTRCFPDRIRNHRRNRLQITKTKDVPCSTRS